MCGIAANGPVDQRYGGCESNGGELCAYAVPHWVDAPSPVPAMRAAEVNLRSIAAAGF